MGKTVAATAVLVLCLAIALSRAQPSSALANVDGPEREALVLSEARASTTGPDLQSVWAAGRRLLKTKTTVKRRKTKWAAGQPTLIGTVVTVAIVVTIVVIFVVFLLITEKKKQDPKWRVRDLFKRRLKPGVKRTLTRRFTRKQVGGGGVGGAGDVDVVEVDEKPKLPAQHGDIDPPKVQPVDAV